MCTKPKETKKEADILKVMKSKQKQTKSKAERSRS